MCLLNFLLRLPFELVFVTFVSPSSPPQASDLDGEIDLSTCYNVTEYQAQRNYGFQIHVRSFAVWILGMFF